MPMPVQVSLVQQTVGARKFDGNPLKQFIDLHRPLPLMVPHARDIEEPAAVHEA
jgi:hypothetical protein